MARVISCAIGCPDGSSATPNVLATANHVTANSAGVQWGNGNGKIALNGVYYQPRGAWIHLANGNTGFNCPANWRAVPAAVDHRCGHHGFRNHPRGTCWADQPAHHL